MIRKHYHSFDKKHEFLYRMKGGAPRQYIYRCLTEIPGRKREKAPGGVNGFSDGVSVKRLSIPRERGKFIILKEGGFQE